MGEVFEFVQEGCVVLNNKNNIFIIYIFNVFMLSVLISYIYRVLPGFELRGTDTHAYIDFFIKNDYYFKQDYLFILFSKFIHVFTENPKNYLFINNFFINFMSFMAIYYIANLYSKSIKKIHVLYFVIILLSFSSYHLLQINALRQAVGLPFLLFSIYFFLKKNYKISYLFLLVASGFHSSYYIIFITYYIFFKLNKNFVKFNLIFIIFSIIFMGSYYYLSNFFSSYYILNKFNTLNRESTGFITPQVKYLYLWIIFITIYFLNRIQIKRFAILNPLLLYYSFLVTVLPFINIRMIINRYFLTGEILLIVIFPIFFINFEKKSRFVIGYIYLILILLFLINFPTIQHEFNFNLKGLI